MTNPYENCCGSCRFSKVSVVKGFEALTCHRYAPKPLIGGVGTGESDWEWPVIGIGEFCGEYATAITAENTDRKKIDG
jgi:hypothetical protein